MTPRPAEAGDAPELVEIARATAVFKPFELEVLAEVLGDYHAHNRDAGHRVTVAVDAGRPAGFCYLAPAAMTDRAWDVWWLAVAPAEQGRGAGKLLLAHAEALARAAGARLVVIETSSTPLYAPARAFYSKSGYRAAGEVADYYADGDGKVIFTKRLAVDPERGRKPPE